LSIVEHPVAGIWRRRPTEGTTAAFDDYQRSVTRIPQRPDPWMEKRCSQASLGASQALLSSAGYRIENGNLLLHGKTVKKGVSLRSVLKDTSTNEVAAILESEAAEATFLLHKGTLTPWASSDHLETAPVLVGGELVSVALEGARVVVRNGAKVVHRRALLPGQTRVKVDQLVAWKGHWIFELDEDVVVDGSSLRRDGDSEVFGWTPIGDAPFFLFVRDGHVGLSYAGRDLPRTYDDVLHGGCCEPSAFNPRSTAWGVRFHARRGETWFLVEVATDTRPPDCEPL
jgi:hypothetical protein